MVLYVCKRTGEGYGTDEDSTLWSNKCFDIDNSCEHLQWMLKLLMEKVKELEEESKDVQYRMTISFTANE